MAEPRCKNCRYWDSDDSYYFEEIDVGVRECNRVKLFWDCTTWGESPPHTRVFTPEAAGSLAFVQDGSDYDAHLLTLPDFGCVQFKAREGP